MRKRKIRRRGVNEEEKNKKNTKIKRIIISCTNLIRKEKKEKEKSNEREKVMEVDTEKEAAAGPGG